MSIPKNTVFYIQFLFCYFFNSLYFKAILNRVFFKDSVCPCLKLSGCFLFLRSQLSKSFFGFFKAVLFLGATALNALEFY